MQLSADPNASDIRHRLPAIGPFGEIDVSILGKTLPENPKTSVVAPYGLLRGVASLTGTVGIP